MSQPKRVVVIGGGTGIYSVVNALRQLPTECSSIINASDSGGSTGRIRDEFGFPPVGDLRQSLAAMADPTSQHWIRQLLLYRFEKGDGLKDHNLGNLILTALQDMTGSTTEALAIAAQVFRIHGRVIPITENNVQLEVQYDDGTVLLGEHLLDESTSPHKKVTRLRLTPEAVINPMAAESIKNAQYIIIGPGDYYASLQSVLIVPGLKTILAKSNAKILYFVNLMTRSTQTKDMTAREHVLGIEASIGRPLDYILVNTKTMADPIRVRYEKEDEMPVIDDLLLDPRVIRSALLSTTATVESKRGKENHPVLRHDEKQVLECLKKIILTENKNKDAN